jgi:hypothetical protein
LSTGALVEALRALTTEQRDIERERHDRATTFDLVKLKRQLAQSAGEWRAALRRRTAKARQILARLFVEKVVFVRDSNGFALRGAISLQMASPAGFAHVGTYLSGRVTWRRAA